MPNRGKSSNPCLKSGILKPDAPATQNTANAVHGMPNRTSEIDRNANRPGMGVPIHMIVSSRFNSDSTSMRSREGSCHISVGEVCMEAEKFAE